MNIVLIGYRGTGKSMVGRLVGQRLHMPCIAMDDKIVEKAGISIPDIVAQQGWPGFRDMESAMAREMAALDHVIIDCGGGIVERPENIDALKANAHVIWLKASVATIVSRIQEDTQRPSLTGEKSFTEEVAEVLQRRTALYKNAAQYEIDTDHLAPQQVAEKVIAIWQAGN